MIRAAARVGVITSSYLSDARWSREKVLEEEIEEETKKRGETDCLITDHSVSTRFARTRGPDQAVGPVATSTMGTSYEEDLCDRGTLARMPRTFGAFWQVSTMGKETCRNLLLAFLLLRFQFLSICK